MDIDAIKDRLTNKFSLPHVSFEQDTIEQKKLLALYVLASDSQLVLLPTYFAFSYPAFIAGLNEKHIEYIAKNAPADYKRELMKAISQSYVLKEVFEIAKSMDEDLGRSSTTNQDRIKNVMRYIRDNRVIFEF
ncbi:MAG TPA: hypothetical protein P5548_01255 [Candidatus Moranbacteria bacterium]|nr:hypothetical protein [Candidatus Moranbacteria bacterium]HRZ33519.1 hypothetical protein [Candidatus Moranbacteria bacterium]